MHHRRQLLTAGFLAALAFALRLWHVGLPPDPLQTLHFSVARGGGQASPELTGLYPWYFFQFKPYLWARPVFYAAVWPWAQVSIEAAQYAMAAASSASAALIYLALRRIQVTTWIAFPVGLVAAAHPAFVLAGARLDPYQLVGVVLLGCVYAQLMGRPLLATILLAAAIGCDRIAIIAGIPLLGLAFAQSRARLGVPAWPLRLDAQASGYAAVMALAPVPLVYSALPTFGFGTPSTPTAVLSTSLLHLFLLMPLLLGLFWPESRPWAILGLTYPLAFLGFLSWLDRTASSDQMAPAGLLALLGAGAGTQALLRQAGPAAARLVSVAGAIAVAILILPAFVTLPSLVNPYSGGTLEEQRTRAEARSSWFEAATWLHGSEQVFLVDVPFESMHYPFHDAADGARTRYAYSNNPENITLWSSYVEAPGARTLVLENSFPLNRVVRTVYADCITESENGWTLIRGDQCTGRGKQLFDSFMAATAPTP